MLSPIEYTILEYLSKRETGISTGEIENAFGKELLSVAITLCKSGYIYHSNNAGTDNWIITDQGHAALLNKKSIEKMKRISSIKGWIIGVLTGILISIIGSWIKYLLFP